MLANDEHMQDVDIMLFNPVNVVNQKELMDGKDDEYYVISSLLPQVNKALNESGVLYLLITK